MTLSEAIRLGSMLKPQGFRTFQSKSRRFRLKRAFPWFSFEEVHTSCAFGAAFDAIGGGVIHQITVRRGEEIRGSMRGNKIAERDATVLEWTPPAIWIPVLELEQPCPACPEILRGVQIGASSERHAPLDARTHCRIRQRN